LINYNFDNNNDNDDSDVNDDKVISTHSVNLTIVNTANVMRHTI